MRTYTASEFAEKMGVSRQEVEKPKYESLRVKVRGQVRPRRFNADKCDHVISHRRGKE